MNPRVVKPNGALLLLCEYHRCQQNRTKKRSDMKYRQHRAAKRQLKRATQQPHSSSMARELVHDSIDCPSASSDRQSLRHASNLTAKRGTKRKNAPSDPRSPADAHYVYARATTFAASPPPAVICSNSRLNTEFRSALSTTEAATPEAMTSASPTTTADFESAASPWLSVWADVLLTPSSPAPQLSPLAPTPASPAAWQPEELELLEYFIMS